MFSKRGSDRSAGAVLLRVTSVQNAKTSAQRGGADRVAPGVNSPDLYTRVTNLIVAELEKGRIPWRKRWGIPEDDTLR